MKFDSNDSLQDFLDDKPFYVNNDCFCLGDTMAEAGLIVNKIVEANTEGNNKDGDGRVDVDNG